MGGGGGGGGGGVGLPGSAEPPEKKEVVSERVRERGKRTESERREIRPISTSND